MSGSVTVTIMPASTSQTLKSLLPLAAICAAGLLLHGCGAPERLPSDLSMEASKEVIKERAIAPLKDADDNEDLEDFPVLPRRSLIQVRHAPASLDDQYFVSTLSKLLSTDPANDRNDETSQAQPTPVQISDSERETIISQRALERTEHLVEKGLEYEAQILAVLQPLEGELRLRRQRTTSGLGDSIPVFGRNLTGNGDEYLEMPNDLVFIGGENGTFTSSTAILKQGVRNPEISFSVRDMHLGDALDFLFGTVGLEAAIADSITSRDAYVTMSVQAGALSIIDAIMQQNDLAIVYDPSIEVAQVYSQQQVNDRLATIRSSIENYNAVLRERKLLARAERDYALASEILGYAQLLLSGDDEGFMLGISSVPREPSIPVTNELIASMTRAALDLRSDMARFERQTGVLLEGRGEFAQLADIPDLAARPDLKNILSEDPCIWPRQEIFTEKVAVYNAVVIEGDDTETGVVGKINSFFAQTRPEDATPGQNDDKKLNASLEMPGYCGAENPAPRVPIVLPDDTGVTVIGTREDNDLVVRLIEQYDVPELQVLIEIFIITVSRDFSRQIDSILSASPSAGGNNNQEFVLSQLASTATRTVGTISMDFDSPNDELGLLLNFIESNSLGRVVSSPTILVASGKDAVVERTQIARVPGPNVLDRDNNSVAGPPVEYEAPFRLEINEVDINRLNNTVKLDVILTDTRFSDTLSKVNELSDRTSDIIDTTFWAAPGDVVVLAGVTRNEEATTTSGLPGTTGALAPASPLLGGSDAFSTNLSETLIFMAPTVINPSADNQPHSAFRNKPKRSIVN
jgi:general secretion pathway protein D